MSRCVALRGNMISASKDLVGRAGKKKAFRKQRCGWNDDMRIEWNHAAQGI